MESSISNSNDKIEVTNQRKGFEGIRMENPFTLKVGQVFTGFGIGCGIGIGVGRPINLGTAHYHTRSLRMLYSISVKILSFNCEDELGWFVYSQE